MKDKFKKIRANKHETPIRDTNGHYVGRYYWEKDVEQIQSATALAVIEEAERIASLPDDNDLYCECGNVDLKELLRLLKQQLIKENGE
jgi:hypothetical protein